MISLAARRYKGLAFRPALFLFALVMLPVTLLVGCRSQPPLHQVEGTALGTGYHITLYADLDDGARELLLAGIQGELASLEQELARLLVPLGQAFRPLGQAFRPLLPGMAIDDDALANSLLQMTWVLAVDRLDALLGDFGVEHAMLELGGVVRARGQARGQPWRLALDRPGLPGKGPLRLRLDDAALVHLDAGVGASREAGEGDDPDAGSRLLAVSVVAPTALEADRQVRELMAAGPEAVALAVDRAVRIVVLTSQGIEIHHGSALEAYLEESPRGEQE